MSVCLASDWLLWATYAVFWHGMFNLAMSFVLVGLSWWSLRLAKRNRKTAEELAEWRRFMAPENTQ